MQIGSNGFNQNHSPVYNNNINSQSIQHQSYHEKTGAISITTDEGDIVTFNQQSLATFEMSSESFSSPLAQGMTFTSTALMAESMSFSVQGDLNEQELADIATLYDSLTTIASDFFNGDYSKAMVGAMSIGDMGSLASLEASFSQTQITATQITTNHAMPLDSENLMNAFNESNLPENNTPMQEQDLLSARWQQISDYLDNQQKIIQEQSLADQKPGGHPAQMMQEIEATLEKHPRLSPYAVSLADKAVQEVAADSELPPIQNLTQKQFFRNDFLKQFQDWLEV